MNKSPRLSSLAWRDRRSGAGNFFNDATFLRLQQPSHLSQNSKRLWIIQEKHAWKLTFGTSCDAENSKILQSHMKPHPNEFPSPENLQLVSSSCQLKRRICSCKLQNEIILLSWQVTWDLTSCKYLKHVETVKRKMSSMFAFMKMWSALDYEKALEGRKVLKSEVCHLQDDE